MEIKLYNTLTRNKEIFVPLRKGAVSMYNCGPTVYDTPHIGNYRTNIMNDLIRRVFEYNDYKVTQVMNITDVDDKTINKSRTEKVSLETVTRKYETLFLEGLKSLNILLPHHLLRATDHIGDMIALIEKLINSGVAYKAKDGVYMSIDKVKNYGALAQLDLSSASHAAEHERIANDEYDKDNPRDFALWKFKDENDGDNSWLAPFGDGRPGWHIECSAMSMSVLGPTIDIHTGGIDLIFPHHTNEIAQSESVTGKQFVRYWVHGAFMTMKHEKMTKSVGNVVKLETLEQETISPLAYRYWTLTAHYRSLVNFSLEAVQGAQNALIRLMKSVGNLPDGGIANALYIERFQTCINDDLDMPKAIALTWDLLKDEQVSDADKRATILDFDKVFGLNLELVQAVAEEIVENVPADISALAEAREEARKEKDWVKADALRQEIEDRGFMVTDTKDGIKVVTK